MGGRCWTIPGPDQKPLVLSRHLESGGRGPLLAMERNVGLDLVLNRGGVLDGISWEKSEPKTIAQPNSPNKATTEIFKRFPIFMDDPIYKVLPAAVQKYNINAPAEKY
jgi:hypothetical protein